MASLYLARCTNGGWFLDGTLHDEDGRSLASDELQELQEDPDANEDGVLRREMESDNNSESGEEYEPKSGEDSEEPDDGEDELEEDEDSGTGGELEEDETLRKRRKRRRSLGMYSQYTCLYAAAS